MDKRYKVYCLKDRLNKIVYIGATRCRYLSQRFGKKYKTFDCSGLKIELIESFDNEKQMFELESMLIKHYGLNNLLNKTETTDLGHPPKGLNHAGCFKKGENGDSRFGNKRKDAAYESRAKPIICSNGTEYSSVSEACRKLNLQSSNILKVIKRLRNHTGGYKFQYINKANTEGK